MANTTAAWSAISTAFVLVTGALLVVCLFKALRAAAQGSGLLSGVVGGPPEPERVAMIVGTVAPVIAYVAQCLSASAGAQHQLVEPQSLLLWSAGLSQLSYLIGKAYRQR